MKRAIGLLLFLPVILTADVTIRYATAMSGSAVPAADRTGSRTVYMKGSMGAMLEHGQLTIVDFARQRVTVADTNRKVFATVSSAEFAGAIAEPETAEEAEIHKSQKAVCQKTAPVAVAETIQGIKVQEYDVTCTTTVAAPGGAIRSVRKLWLATPDERVRVPGLWQLSGFESWQENFMTPSPGAEDGVEKTILDALRKGQSATLREKTEMSMQLPGSTGADGYTQVFSTTEEVVSISTELLDDSLFRVKADFREEPMASVWKGLGSAATADVTPENDAAPKPAIPENVKAFIPVLFPLHTAEPEAPAGSDGKKVQGEVQFLLTIGPQGNVEQAEVLSGPEGLRDAATKAVRQYTFRPVLRDGAAVTAYTETTVNFIDYSHGPPDMSAFQLTPEMEAAEQRLLQLETAFPRSPEQELADIEQDSGGGDNERRYHRLGEMALKSARLNADDKAKAYATELLAAGIADGYSWNYGNSIHDGHIALGLVALHRDDVPAASRELLEAGKTPGSPQLNSFGPDMSLAAELFKKGESEAVLQYLDLCRKFWKMGTERLDTWSAAVRDGKVPSFGPPLR